MGRKKVDVKICSHMKSCIASRQRAFFILTGTSAMEQVVVLYYLLHKNKSNEDSHRIPILWCYKKDHGFNYISLKTQKILKKKYSGSYSLSDEDCFNHFLASVEIKFCHYSNTISVLGQTFGMLVIQDFEAVTPNILARIIECVEGGGIIIIIISNAQSFQDISCLKMDAHNRYVTSAHPHVHPLFNQRFLLSLRYCKNCIVLDDNLKIHMLHLNPICSQMVKMNLGEKLQCSNTNSTNVLTRISALCCTEDQVNALKLFINQLQNNTSSVISLTSARGRGKSAALGLAVASALYLKYSNIYITSPLIENLQTLFSFILKGIEAFDCKEGKDYNILLKSVEKMKLIYGIDLFQFHKQVVRYNHPSQYSKVEIADLIIIDEAAAIPLPIVKRWLNSNLIFMASTITGYEGTGRSLSLKLLSQLRKQSSSCSVVENNFSSYCRKKFTFHEVILNEAIRYADGDCVESWLNSLFCLNSEVCYFDGDFPSPETCQLYYVNRKVLFSYHNIAEKFLQHLLALFVSSHYKNCPNDLFMMADAPSHHIFCLLPPISKNMQCLPKALCVIQVSLEGKLSKENVIQEFSYGKRASGDLIPWIISQQFQNNNFPMLSGARIVRIATHPSCQRMGYGQRALQLMFSYYKESFITNMFYPLKTKEHTLLLKLNELEPQNLDYVGVSYGLTLELLKFWKKLGFIPLYLRQTANEITGEYSCVMVKELTLNNSICLSEYIIDFLERFLILLSSAFQNLPSCIALEILHCRRDHIHYKTEFYNISHIKKILTTCSIKRLEAYCNHQVDYHLIMDLMPILSRYYFMFYFEKFFLSSIQEAILLCLCLQNKAVEDASLELDIQVNELMGFFHKTVKKILLYLSCSDQIQNQQEIVKRKQPDMFPTGKKKRRNIQDNA